MLFLIIYFFFLVISLGSLIFDFFYIFVHINPLFTFIVDNASFQSGNLGSSDFLNFRRGSIDVVKGEFTIYPAKYDFFFHSRFTDNSFLNFIVTCRNYCELTANSKLGLGHVRPYFVSIDPNVCVIFSSDIVYLNQNFAYDHYFLVVQQPSWYQWFFKFTGYSNQPMIYYCYKAGVTPLVDPVGSLHHIASYFESLNLKLN